MTSHDFVLFALQIATMLACALLLGRLMQALRQPAVLGEMLGGIVLGPTILGGIAPEWQAWLFPTDGAVSLVRAGTIKLGMLLFLFIVGLEINIEELRRHGKSAVLIGLFGSLVPLVAGVATVYLLPNLWSEQAVEHRLAYALYFGACLANTANPVLARILLDLGLLNQNIGAVLMTATIVDDLVGWSLLPIVFADFAVGETPTLSVGHSAALVVGLFGALLCFGRYVATPLLRWAKHVFEWPTGFIGLVVVIVLLSAAGAEQLGVHAFLGPFLVGIALAPSSQERSEAYAVISQFAMSFFAPLYFVSLGLTSNFIADFDLALVTVVLIVACVSKISSVYAAGRISGMDSSTSLAVGFGMNARGAVGIILAALGREHGVIDQRTYVALVLMAIVTSLAAGPAMKALLPERCS